MTSRQMRRGILTLLGILMPLHAASATDRPNVLLFIADDMTYHDCGAYGSEIVKTPHIDRLAREGMLFQKMFTSTAMCAPTRQQLYTGVWPIRNGAYPNHSRVRDGAKSWVHHFRELGYRSGLVGKTHVGPPESYPWERISKSKAWELDAIRDFIGRDDTEPFFLVAAHNDPHAPWNHGDAAAYPPADIIVPPYLVDTPETRDALSHYYAEITYMDSQMGDVLELVDESGRQENTIVIFTSEQGGSYAFGGKWTCEENGLRTSFVVRWPARVKAGTSTDAMCQYIDVLPTLIEAAEGDPLAIDTGIPGGADGRQGFDGRSFLPVLLSESDRLRDYTFGAHTNTGIINGTPYPIRSVRGERYKYVRNLNHEATYSNAVTQLDRPFHEVTMFASWLAAGGEAAERASRYQHRPAEELYDLNADPYELHNLAGQPQLSDVQQELRQELDRWMNQQGDEGLATEHRANERQGKRKTAADP